MLAVTLKTVSCANVRLANVPPKDHKCVSISIHFFSNSTQVNYYCLQNKLGVIYKTEHKASV